MLPAPQIHEFAKRNRLDAQAAVKLGEAWWNTHTQHLHKVVAKDTIFVWCWIKSILLVTSYVLSCCHAFTRCFYFKVVLLEVMENRSDVDGDLMKLSKLLRRNALCFLPNPGRLTMLGSLFCPFSVVNQGAPVLTHNHLSHSVEIRPLWKLNLKSGWKREQLQSRKGRVNCNESKSAFFWNVRDHKGRYCCFAFKMLVAWDMSSKTTDGQAGVRSTAIGHLVVSCYL